MKKNAFTLSELSVAMIVMGVLTALLVPSIAKLTPNSDKIMFRKAYSSVEKVVSELLNDDKFYAEDDVLIGLLNTNAVIVAGTTYSGAAKFCNLFTQKINIAGNANCSASQTVTTGSLNLGTGNFRTNDGITWYIPVSAFTSGSDGEIETITVDVNGTAKYNNKSPNCKYNASTCKVPDQFEFKIRNDGKIIVDGTKEMEYLQSVEN